MPTIVKQYKDSPEEAKKLFRQQALYLNTAENKSVKPDDLVFVIDTDDNGNPVNASLEEQPGKIFKALSSAVYEAPATAGSIVAGTAAAPFTGGLGSIPVGIVAGAGIGKAQDALFEKYLPSVARKMEIVRQTSPFINAAAGSLSAAGIQKNLIAGGGKAALRELTKGGKAAIPRAAEALAKSQGMTTAQLGSRVAMDAGIGAGMSAAMDVGGSIWQDGEKSIGEHLSSIDPMRALGSGLGNVAFGGGRTREYLRPGLDRVTGGRFSRMEPPMPEEPQGAVGQLGADPTGTPVNPPGMTYSVDPLVNVENTIKAYEAIQKRQAENGGASVPVEDILKQYNLGGNADLSPENYQRALATRDLLKERRAKQEEAKQKKEAAANEEKAREEALRNLTGTEPIVSGPTDPIPDMIRHYKGKMIDKLPMDRDFFVALQKSNPQAFANFSETVRIAKETEAAKKAADEAAKKAETEKKKAEAEAAKRPVVDLKTIPPDAPLTRDVPAVDPANVKFILEELPGMRLGNVPLNKATVTALATENPVAFARLMDDAQKAQVVRMEQGKAGKTAPVKPVEVPKAPVETISTIPPVTPTATIAAAEAPATAAPVTPTLETPAPAKPAAVVETPVVLPTSPTAPLAKTPAPTAIVESPARAKLRADIIRHYELLAQQAEHPEDKKSYLKQAEIYRNTRTDKFPWISAGRLLKRQRELDRISAPAKSAETPLAKTETPPENPETARLRARMVEMYKWYAGNAKDAKTKQEYLNRAKGFQDGSIIPGQNAARILKNWEDKLAAESQKSLEPQRAKVVEAYRSVIEEKKASGNLDEAEILEEILDQIVKGRPLTDADLGILKYVEGIGKGKRDRTAEAETGPGSHSLEGFDTEKAKAAAKKALHLKNPQLKEKGLQFIEEGEILSEMSLIASRKGLPADADTYETLAKSAVESIYTKREKAAKEVSLNKVNEEGSEVGANIPNEQRGVTPGRYDPEAEARQKKLDEYRGAFEKYYVDHSGGKYTVVSKKDGNVVEGGFSTFQQAYDRAADLQGTVKVIPNEGAAVAETTPVIEGASKPKTARRIDPKAQPKPREIVNPKKAKAKEPVVSEQELKTRKEIRKGILKLVDELKLKVEESWIKNLEDQALGILKADPARDPVQLANDLARRSAADSGLVKEVEPISTSRPDTYNPMGSSTYNDELTKGLLRRLKELGLEKVSADVLANLKTRIWKDHKQNPKKPIQEFAYDDSMTSIRKWEAENNLASYLEHGDEEGSSPASQLSIDFFGTSAFSHIPGIVKLASRGLKAIGKPLIKKLTKPLEVLTEQPFAGVGERLKMAFPMEGAHLQQAGKLLRNIVVELQNRFDRPVDVAVKSLKPSKEEIKNVTEYMDNLEIYDGWSPTKLTDREKELYNALRSSLLDSGTIPDAPWINNTRPKEFNEFYAAGSIMSKDVRKALRARSPEGEAFRAEYREWYKAQTGDDSVAAADHALNLLAGLSKTKIDQGQPSYAAVRKAEGIGLPVSMREKSILNRLYYNNARTAADIGYHRVIEKNPALGRMFGHMNDGAGTDYYQKDLSGNPITDVDSMSPEDRAKFIPPGETTPTRELSGNEHLERIRDELMLARNANSDIVEQLGGLVNSMRLGPTTTIRDIGSSLTVLANHVPAKEWGNIIGAFDGMIGNAQKKGYVKGKRQADWNAMEIGVSEGLTKAADFFRMISGRELGEKAIRSMVANFGEIIARNQIGLADSPFMDTMVGKNWKSLPEDQAIRIAGQGLMEQVQGNYTWDYLPARLLRSHEGQAIRWIFNLQRWSIERARRFREEVILPMAREGDIKPLLKQTLGGMIGMAGVETMLEVLFGQGSRMVDAKDMIKLAMSDISTGQKLDEFTHELAARFQMMGIGGVYSSLLNNISQIRHGEPLLPVENPAWSFAGDFIQRTMNAVEGLGMPDGVVSGVKFLASLGMETMMDEVQALRVIRNRLEGKGEDRRLEDQWKRVTGQTRADVKFSQRANRFSPTTQLKRAKTEEEVIALSGKLSEYYQRRGLKHPTSIENPVKDPGYYRYLSSVQGPETAEFERMKDEGKKRLVEMKKATARAAFRRVN